MEFQIKNHILVPRHERLDEESSRKLLDKYNITKLQLPRISKKDAAIKGLDIKPGDIIKITRSSSTAGKTVFFRVVVDE